MSSCYLILYYIILHYHAISHYPSLHYLICCTCHYVSDPNTMIRFALRSTAGGWCWCWCWWRWSWWCWCPGRQGYHKIKTNKQNQTRPMLTRPDQSRPNQTRPDRTNANQTRPDQNGLTMDVDVCVSRSLAHSTDRPTDRTIGWYAGMIHTSCSNAWWEGRGGKGREGEGFGCE